MLRFRDLGGSFSIGASFSRFRCFVFEFWVLRASVFETILRVLRFRNYRQFGGVLNAVRLHFFYFSFQPARLQTTIYNKGLGKARVQSNFETRFEKKINRLLSVYNIVTVVFLAKLFRLNNISIYSRF